MRTLEDTGRLVAYSLTAARRYTDRFERIRRRRDDLAAEIQWELLPVLAYDTAEFAIAGNLEPAYEIAGDTFDYAVGRDRLTVTITDAIGHGLRAALLGGLAVTTMRNQRRAGADIIEQADEASAQLEKQFGEESYATGFLVQLDPATGTGIAVNAGHPPPLLLRAGHVRSLRVPPDIPLGIFPGTHYRPHRISMRTGDRLLFYSGGITEATNASDEPYGTSRLAAHLRHRRDVPPVEAVRHLTRDVTNHQGGDVRDDATVVCLDWH